MRQQSGIKSAIKIFMLISVTALLLTACGETEQAAAPAAPRAAPTVDVAQVVSQRISDWDHFTGRLQAPETVRLIPRISGYIQQVHFKEGALVKQGELLFQIDPAPFETEVKRLKAQLQRAKTAKQLADNEYARAKKLHQQQAIAEEMLDTRFANQQQAAADLSAQRAALNRAELELAYTRITAPISGRVSNAQVTQGNYVSAGQTPLTSLVSTDHMYAYFDIDEQTYLDHSQLMSQAQKQADPSTAVYMALANEAEYSRRGEIDFIDNAVNPRTGSIRVRAVFSNQDQSLLPGLFARIKLMSRDPYQGILIDEKAISTDLNNKFVLLVNDKQQLEYRPVILGKKINNLRIIKSGLSHDDHIVVNGLQRVRPGMPVSPNRVSMATEAQLSQLQAEQAQLDAAHAQTLNTTSDAARG